MKKIIILLSMVCLLLTLSSCKKSIEEVDEPVVITLPEKDNKPNAPENQQAEEEEAPLPEATTDEATVPEASTEISVVLPISPSWAMTLDDQMVELAYEAPTYQPSVVPYKWSEDLSDLHNVGQYSGFTDQQLKMLNTNGFVVLRENSDYPYLKMHYGYEASEYNFNPIFITSDIVLHMYRTYYSESMKVLELTDYYPKLQGLSLNLYEQVRNDFEQSTGAVKEELKYVYTYIAVANELLGQEVTVPKEIEVLVDQELNRIEAHKGIEMSEFYGKKVDYSQYTVRGHYTLNEDLGKFFKAMMWYGQSGIQLSDKNELKYEGITRACMMTHLVFQDEANVTAWSDIYRMTKLYSGYADDLTIFDMKELMLAVYGQENLSYDAYIDASFRPALVAAFETLRPAMIVAKTNQMPIGYDFRLMGQRYTLDAYIMQNLMEPFTRPAPTAFDVMTAFGHEEAEEILYEYYTTNQYWSDYDAKLAEMKTYVEDYSDQAWRSDLYHGWLWAIDAAAEGFEGAEGLPEFMTNKAWRLKSLGSALGSYAQLKHDNVLYSKQAFAERGGDWFKDQEFHYVEANPELYSRLLWLAEATKLNMLASDQVSEAMVEPINRMIELLELFETVSIKELQGEEVTDEEFVEMRSIGGYIDYLTYYYQFLLNDSGVEMPMPETDALISDVATIGDVYLEEAVGLPYDIYVVCQVNDVTFMAKGAVFSYYEFVSDERLTDEQWTEMVGVNLRSEWGTKMYGGPSLLMTEVMPWSTVYISDEPNNTMTQSMELIWGE